MFGKLVSLAEVYTSSVCLNIKPTITFQKYKKLLVFARKVYIMRVSSFNIQSIDTHNKYCDHFDLKW